MRYDMTFIDMNIHVPSSLTCIDFLYIFFGHMAFATQCKTAKRYMHPVKTMVSLDTVLDWSSPLLSVKIAHSEDIIGQSRCQG